VNCVTADTPTRRHIHHLVNIVLHCIISAQVFTVLQRVCARVECDGELVESRSRNAAFIAAVLFAVHPVHTECVCPHVLFAL
jgi:hypothetical protein